ncbi:polysaccharide biosynthesis protein [Micromonospora sp. NPDC126480]|uniref:NAD-dependent epimerase/dehydratase family protein n=1 Tax=Micromonospora sp. NPDC126480 TaxID=3155312 RepID=UPI00331CAC30
MAAVRGRRIVVTGGSGCLGTALLRRLNLLGPVALMSAAITPPTRPVPGVRYLQLDIRDYESVSAFMREHRPEAVFHLAAQRDPGLAEFQVARTVHTNVMGTRNVAEAAERAGAKNFVYASTGKALRPYSSDIYAESKRMGEWVVSQVAARGNIGCAGVRFTHVVDNSIVLQRFRRWCRTGNLVRLHSPDTLFYAQSAAESAQLMLAALVVSAKPVMRLCMIRDLGWPVNLLDLALGVVAESGGVAPLYIAGHEPGYEEMPYPGLYDPMLAGNVSPLMNAMEAHNLPESESQAVDVISVHPVSAPALTRRMPKLEELCTAGDDAAVRIVFDEMAWNLMEQIAVAAPAAAVKRMVQVSKPYRALLSPEHRKLDEILRRAAYTSSAEDPGGVTAR